MTAFNLDPDQVRQLAELLRETGLAELEYAEGDRRIRIARPVVAPAAVPFAAPPAAAALAPEEAETAHPGTIASPMVGTVYFSAEPGAPPFVSVGDRVKAEQTLLIIEAMKVMNPIRAPRAGTVTKLLVGNGAPVEYGEPLLILE